MLVEDSYGTAGTNDASPPFLEDMWPSVTYCDLKYLEIVWPNGTFHTMLLAKEALIIVQNQSQNLGFCSAKPTQRPGEAN